MAGERDRFQPVRLYHLQRAALVNARSVTGRISTRAEHAENAFITPRSGCRECVGQATRPSLQALPSEAATSALDALPTY